jgi:hypothetical protein
MSFLYVLQGVILQNIDWFLGTRMLVVFRTSSLHARRFRRT